MSHIAIDARVINSGTGTYVVKLLEYLQKIDHQNTYSVLSEFIFFRGTLETTTTVD